LEICSDAVHSVLLSLGLAVGAFLVLGTPLGGSEPKLTSENRNGGAVIGTDALSIRRAFVSLGPAQRGLFLRIVVLRLCFISRRDDTRK
jgi:hypothetical protein